MTQIFCWQQCIETFCNISSGGFKYQWQCLARDGDRGRLAQVRRSEWRGRLCTSLTSARAVAYTVTRWGALHDTRRGVAVALGTGAELGARGVVAGDVLGGEGRVAAADDITGRRAA